MSSWRQASATSGSSTGVTTKDAPASFASRTAPGSHTVPTPTGYRPIVVAINPRIISKHEGTVFVTSIVLTPPSMAVRQAWKPASALSVRSTPHTPLGKASAIDFIDRLRLVEGGHHPGTCNQAPIEKRIGDFASLYVGLNGSTQHLMKSRQGCLQEGGVIEARKVQTPTEATHGRPDGGVVDATGRRRAGDANRSPHGPLRQVGPKLHP